MIGLILLLCAIVFFYVVHLLIKRDGGWSLGALCAATVATFSAVWGIALISIYIYEHPKTPPEWDQSRRDRAISSEVRVLEIPQSEISLQFERTGTVTNAPQKQIGKDLVLLVVKLDPQKDSGLNFVSAVAPVTQGGRLWTAGDKVKLSFISVELSDKATPSHPNWFVQ